MQSPPEELVALLTQRSAVPAPAGWTPLTGGKTNRSWHVQLDGVSWVVKLYAGETGNPLFPNSARHEAALLRLLAPTGLAPQLIDMVSTARGTGLIYTYQNGMPWREDPALVARALSLLHRQDPTNLAAGLRPLEGGSDRLITQTETIIARLPETAQHRLRTLQPKGSVPAADRAVLLHGDLVPGNVIVDRSHVTLIDWQCPAIGDPVEDLAVFLSPAMQQIYRGRPLSASEKSAFIAGYDRSNLRKRIDLMAPWYHWRMAAYCAWKSAQGQREYERAGALEIAALTA
ncbi:thiamine kinase [Thalassovita gelatinovora]|uniref:Thiamine kinase n=1 Tax=Thalassovita gelatinovora TaxID=53501 RepID=A0A0P1F9D2_THAGE|nr:aminoglycoside phosphotransferase family protein [Thalassovita gelatinovora]QIZ81152.1 aminoglycoside phosphotransferase family protein [Thalassovita gelatinovora]CUH64807.1 thiamine kinase [Thalassovita gelatinovora]SEP91704.1 Predicted kinase, aminoglycoside phosphotransferase (APT) family [Thalassovita gelatinovora]